VNPLTEVLALIGNLNVAFWLSCRLFVKPCQSVIGSRFTDRCCRDTGVVSGVSGYSLEANAIERLGLPWAFTKISSERMKG
jgi:hypothetical protein